MNRRTPALRGFFLPGSSANARLTSGLVPSILVLRRSNTVQIGVDCVMLCAGR